MMKTFILLLVSALANSTELVQCSDKKPFYFKFLPVNFATLRPSETKTVVGRCFQDIKFTLKEDQESFEMEFFVKDKNSWLCSELIILTNGKSPQVALPMITGSYKYVWNKNLMNKNEITYTQTHGIRVLMSCEDLSSWPQSIFMTLKLYLGGLGLNPHIPIFGSKVPEYQLNANLEFIKGATGFEYERLPHDHYLHIDKHKVKSGTFIAIYRFDGIDNMIHAGSGSKAGHSTVALWHDNELYVVESQNALYWPTFGIQKTKWDDWMKWAHNADYNVVLLPLNDEYQAKFDEKKAWEWFEHICGQDYGFHNFLFSWLDSPSDNLPVFLDFDTVSFVLEYYQYIRPTDVKLIFLEAFNKRLGIEANNIKEIWDELYARNMTLGELTSIVEQEGWEYSNGVNYVCSAFVVSVYKRAGLFGDLEINSTEFTPKDLYELNFFDVTGAKVPEGCEEYAPLATVR